MSLFLGTHNHNDHLNAFLLIVILWWPRDVIVEVLNLQGTGSTHGYSSVSVNDLRQVVHMCLCHETVQFGASCRTAMFCGWEGNPLASHWLH